MTVEQALSAAGTVLQRDGFDGFSMPAVAAEAGMAPSTLYQYFPNKYMILRRLVERWYDKTGQPRSVQDRNTDISGLAKMYFDEPGCVALLEAVQAVPELRHYDRETTERAVVRRARQISRGKSPTRRQLAQARVLVVAVDNVLREAARLNRRDADEVVQVLKMWLASLNSDDPHEVGAPAFSAS